MTIGRDGDGFLNDMSEWTIDVLVERGAPLPEWYVEQPALFLGGEFYMNAFMRLSTCRQVGMTLGPIPWDKAEAYIQSRGFSTVFCDFFLQVIYEMDSAWIEWQEKRRKKVRKKAK